MSKGGEAIELSKSHVTENVKSKNPFNKKKWREQKYSTRVKVKQWEDRKRISALRKYHREFKKEFVDNRSFTAFKNQKIKENERLTPFQKAQLAYQKKQEEKRRQEEEIRKSNMEKEKALAAYRDEKTQKFRKLSMKTKKGQPVMKGRMELLLEKIQKEFTQN